MFVTAGFLLLVIVVLTVVAAIVSGGLARVWPALRPASGGRGQAVPSVSWDAERIFIYALAFAGLMAMVYAIAGLAATVVVAAAQQSSALIGGSVVRDRTSYYLASIVVGTPIWLSLWLLAQRRLGRSPLERQARERRWYLAAIFAVASVVALFGLRSLLQNILTLPGADDITLTVRDGIFAGARLLVWGIVWWVYARLGWRERSPGDRDVAHDVAVYVLSGFALIFLVIGLGEAGRHIIGDAIAPTRLADGNKSLWRDWGDIAAWVVTGGLAWATIWRYDLVRGGHRLARVYYLYLVLAVSAPAALFNGGNCLYEILRRAFGYHTAQPLLFLQDVLPPLLIGGAVWAYHWTVMRDQAGLARDTDAPSGALPWPRHPAVVVLNLGGLVVTSVALTSLLWLAIDRVLNTGVALSGGDWWRDRLSVGLTGVLIGALIWLPAWAILQRSAAADPVREQRIQIRFRLLGLIVLAGILASIGFAVALLWTVFRAMLGGTFDAETTSGVLKDLIAVLVALALAGYHAVYLRGERRRQLARPREVRVLALVMAGADDVLAEIARAGGRTIELLGHLDGDPEGHTVDPSGLEGRLAALEAEGSADGTLLIVRPDGVDLFAYTRAAAGRRTAEDVAPPRPAQDASGTGESAISPA